jgi:cyclopentanol dehydrogenase
MADRLLEGMVALVTGGANGIGAAICRHFAGEGAAVHIADVADDRARALAGEIGGACHHLDVTDEASWSETVAAVLAAHGRIDVLVNNAGIALSFIPLHERTPEEWLRIMAVNATGVFLGLRAVIPAMIEKGGGSIVNISSAAALGQWEIMESAYAASKAAVRVLTKTAGTQYAAQGIRCNSIHPGPIDGEMAQAVLGANPAVLEHRLSRVPMRRLGRPSEIAAAAAFLASPRSSYMTGAELVVDGGAVAQ